MPPPSLTKKFPLHYPRYYLLKHIFCPILFYLSLSLFLFHSIKIILFYFKINETLAQTIFLINHTHIHIYTPTPLKLTSYPNQNPDLYPHLFSVCLLLLFREYIYPTTTTTTTTITTSTYSETKTPPKRGTCTSFASLHLNLCRKYHTV